MDGLDWPGRWDHVRKFLERTGPFAHPDFEPSTEVCKLAAKGEHTEVFMIISIKVGIPYFMYYPCNIFCCNKGLTYFRIIVKLL